MTPLFSRALCGLTLAGMVAGTAIAATPENGTVNEATPKVEWVGETTGGYLSRMPTAVSGSTETPCQAPSCDTFMLKVEKSATLTVAESLDSDSETAAFTLRITKPDGEVIQTDSEPGAAANKYVKVVIKNAPVGDYEINHYDNSANGMSFKAYAELAVAGATPTGGNPTQPTPQDPPPTQPTQPQTPPQQPQQQGGSVQAIDLQVKVGKASARKLNKSRKLAATVTVSREVKSITAALKKGKKVVGKGKLGTTSGTKKLTLKLAKKKLKKGTYTLAVVATDGSTSTEKVIKVKVKK